MKIDKEYVLNHREIAMDDHLRADSYKYCSVFAGCSDIASLAYRTSKPGEIGEISFGEDATYYPWLIAGDTPVPEHYQGRLILDTDASWLWIYDDDNKTLDLENQAGFQIYRAGELGMLIRFK